jgi:hypothetical protein
MYTLVAICYRGGEGVVINQSINQSLLDAMMIIAAQNITLNKTPPSSRVVVGVRVLSLVVVEGNGTGAVATVGNDE